ncbi:MAG TPA: hypothetical protein VIZ90_05820 [Rhizobiaceae bacterium]
MSAELIREHFTQYLGADVGVSFRDADNPREVTLYRPDRLPDLFVTWAFEALEKAAPRVAWNIDRLLVSFDDVHGVTRRGVAIPRKDGSAGWSDRPPEPAPGDRQHERA